MTEPSTVHSGQERGTLYFVGNATTLIRCNGFTILTDPNFLHRGQRAYLGHGITAKRLTEPALGVHELPELDAIVLSHLHGDHWDRNAQAGLDRDIPILTTPHASRKLQRRRFHRALGLPTWRGQTLFKDGATLRVTALPGKHAPAPLGRLLPPVMGSMLEFGDGTGRVDLRLYLTGDTLMFDGVGQIAEQYPDIDVGVLHLGGTRLPGGVLVTMDGAQGADLLQETRPGTGIPVHYDDYDRFTSPLADFDAAVHRRGLAQRVKHVPPGTSVPLFRGATQAAAAAPARGRTG